MFCSALVRAACVGLLLFLSPATSTAQESSALGVLRQPLGAAQPIAVRVATHLPLLLQFPRPCEAVYVDPDACEAEIDPRDPRRVTLLVRPHLPLGSLLRASVVCEGQIYAALRLRVASMAQAVARIEFYPPTQTLGVDAVARAAAQRFVCAPLRQSTRAQGMVLHADCLRQLGEVSLLELRLQNRGSQPVQLHQVRVLPHVAGTSAPPSWRASALASPTGALSVSGHGAQLAAGKVWRLRLGWHWPLDAGAFWVRLQVAPLGDAASSACLCLGPVGN